MRSTHPQQPRAIAIARTLPRGTFAAVALTGAQLLFLAIRLAHLI